MLSFLCSFFHMKHKCLIIYSFTCCVTSYKSSCKINVLFSLASFFHVLFVRLTSVVDVDMLAHFFIIRVDVRCCANFCCPAEWLSYTHLCMLLYILYHHGLAQEIGSSSQGYTSGLVIYPSFTLLPIVWSRHSAGFLGTKHRYKFSQNLQ